MSKLPASFILTMELESGINLSHLAMAKVRSMEWRQVIWTAMDGRMSLLPGLMHPALSCSTAHPRANGDCVTRFDQFGDRDYGRVSSHEGGPGLKSISYPNAQ